MDFNQFYDAIEEIFKTNNVRPSLISDTLQHVLLAREYGFRVAMGVSWHSIPSACIDSFVTAMRNKVAPENFGPFVAYLEAFVKQDPTRFTVGTVLRIPHYNTMPPGSFRTWKITGVHLGGTGQEGTFAMVPLDVTENEPIHVPCILIIKNPLIEVM